jgi:hypothetical protein
MHRKNSETKYSSLFDTELLQGIFEAEHSSTHDQKWASFTQDPRFTEFVSKALTKANHYQMEEVNPRDAYLHAIADFYEVMLRREMIDNMVVPDDASALTVLADPEV